MVFQLVLIFVTVSAIAATFKFVTDVSFLVMLGQSSSGLKVSWTLRTLVSMLVDHMLQDLLESLELILAIVILALQGVGRQHLGVGMINVLVSLQMKPGMKHLLAIDALKGFQIVVDVFQVLFLLLDVGQLDETNGAL